MISSSLKANYCLLDGARLGEKLDEARNLNPDHSCLYEGDSERFMEAVAPWLFSFDTDSSFADWVLESQHGRHWGVFFDSDAEPAAIYKHLRKFLVVKAEDGQELYFRYYDPRVLRVFLPTCDKRQLESFFGPIKAFTAEDENGMMVKYGLENNTLVVSQDISSGQNYKPAESSTQDEDQSLSDSERKDQLEDGGVKWDFGY